MGQYEFLPENNSKMVEHLQIIIYRKKARFVMEHVNEAKHWQVVLTNGKMACSGNLLKFYLPPYFGNMIGEHC